MTRYVVLLRGINVGKHRRMPMADLRDLLVRLGYEDVRTHLQSGNVVLASDDSPAALVRKIEAAIAAELTDGVEVFVRTSAEIADVVARNPLAKFVDDPSRYHVSFCSAKPAAAALREMKAVDVGEERFVVLGREIFAWYPGGVQNSPLVKLLSEKRLGVRITARNWNTVTKLLELAGER
jgi:uncharacterized protein (DUF1697 family)